MRLLSATLILVVCGCSCEDGLSKGTTEVNKQENANAKVTPTSIVESVASENSFYPSFSRFDYHPLGHSRPYYFNQQQEGAYSQRSEPFQQVFDAPEKFSGYKDTFQPVAQAPSEPVVGLLGSGNFGVIPGGTFYNDNDGQTSTKYENFDSYFHNGHGRPSFYYGGASNPKPYKHEHFANFKDFADINTPPERQYSEYVVVYVNNNDTKVEGDAKKVKHAPKNIIESLAMLDLETTTTTETIPTKKLSKSKRKLSKLLPEKKHFAKSVQKSKIAKETESEPMLALS